MVRRLFFMEAIQVQFLLELNLTMQGFASDMSYFSIYLFWFLNSLSFLLIGIPMDNKLSTTAGSRLAIWLTIFTSILSMFLLYNFKVSDTLVTNSSWFIISDFHTRIQILQMAIFTLVLASFSCRAVSGGKELHMDVLFCFWFHKFLW